MCLCCFFGSILVAELPPFGNELLTRFAVCSLCILTILILVISRFGFAGWILVMIPSVPGICILFFTFKPTLNLETNSWCRRYSLEKAFLRFPLTLLEKFCS